MIMVAVAPDPGTPCAYNQNRAFPMMAGIEKPLPLSDQQPQTGAISVAYFTARCVLPVNRGLSHAPG